MSWQLAAALAAAFAFGLGAGLLTGVRYRRRMTVLRDGVAELTRGNVAHRIIIPGDDGVTRMAEQVNAFADTVQAEREAAAARDKAQRQLMTNISHDLRTPIASVAGYVDALQRGLGDDPERYLSIIGTKTDELAELTDDLFYEARLDAGDIELTATRLDLAEAVRRAILGFEGQLAGRGVRVCVELPEKACMVDADSSALARILGNLISNALRHAERMTSLTASLTECGERYQLRFGNDGAVVPEDAERLFERGMAGAGGGSGLGLSIARELAGRMGGTVGLERPGGGEVALRLSFPKATPRD